MATRRRSARLSSLAASAPSLGSVSPPTSVASSRKRKAAPETKPGPDGPPSTPQKRRTQKPQSAVLNRLADPSVTHAQLLSPETSRVVSAKKLAEPPASPSKLSSRATTTTTLLEQACAYLVEVEPRMKPLVDAHHCRTFSPEGLAEKVDPFERLVSGIISQQVSGAAAKTIKARFIALFYDEGTENPEGADGKDAADAADVSDIPAHFPHPSQVVKTPMERLRSAGLSQRKAEYITGLAEKFVSGELSAQMLADAPYEEIVEKLTAVRGLGRWSVEMFACFALKRIDVFSLGDLGVQRGMAAFTGRDVAKLKAKGGGKWKYMNEKDMVELSDRFKPYRSLFMWYMWRVEGTDISTLE